MSAFSPDFPQVRVCPGRKVLNDITFRQKRLSMELLKALKAEYGGISQAQGEKLLKMVQELVEDLSDEVMEALT